MTRPDAARASQTKKRTRIQTVNQEKILDGALEVFSRYGYRGATVDQIARACGMSKPNLLYYFRRKHDLYVAVLKRTLEMWLGPLEEMDPAGDPAAELSKYIARKMEFSRTNPQESRLFASEVLQGAPLLHAVLEGRVRDLVEKKAEVIRAWIADGKIAAVDPYHLIFMLWATTQHYADFESQIAAILPAQPRQETLDAAARTLPAILLRGVLPRR